jgi:hypothetical protein
MSPLCVGERPYMSKRREFAQGAGLVARYNSQSPSPHLRLYLLIVSGYSTHRRESATVRPSFRAWA